MMAIMLEVMAVALYVGLKMESLVLEGLKLPLMSVLRLVQMDRIWEFLPVMIVMGSVMMGAQINVSWR